MRLWQEFYCTTSGGGCGGYILVKINMSLNRRVEIICPKCKHSHRRNIINGLLQEDGRFSGEAKEEITPTLAAWSKVSLINPEQKKPKFERIAEKVELSGDEVQAQEIMRESWISRFAGKLLTK